MRLRLWSVGGEQPPARTAPPATEEHIPCGFHGTNNTFAAVGIMRWSDGKETPVCAAHQAWLFDCLDELEELITS